jgi:CelD/BcsL family acetyltransferase involved in cellulose biosynthesis
MPGDPPVGRREASPIRSSSRAGVALELITSPAGFAALEPAWKTLAERQANIFLTWEWMAAWREQVAPQDALRVVAVLDEGGDLVGVAPFVVRQQRLWRELVFMGCTVAAPDHLDCIVRAGWQGPVGAAVAEWLENPPRRPEWDVVRLDGMRPESALVQTLMTTVPPRLTAMWSVDCPFVPLTDSWEEFRSRLSGNFRRNLGRRLRKLKREAPGPVRFETVTGGPGLDAAMMDLVDLHDSARRVQGQRGAFDSAVRRRFYHALVQRFAERGWLRLYRLTVDEKPVASVLGFSYADKVMLYQLGYDPRWGTYGPGYLITRYMVESAIDEGASELDMLRGSHPYKFEWNAERRTIVKLRLASSAAGGVLAPMTRWLRAARKGWKSWRGIH